MRQYCVLVDVENGNDLLFINALLRDGSVRVAHQSYFDYNPRVFFTFEGEQKQIDKIRDHFEKE